MNEHEFDSVLKDSKKDLDTIRSVNTAIKRTILLLSALSYFLVTVTTGTIGYWYFEPDPLDVRYVNGEAQWSLCSDRKYTFKRLVYGQKDLTIGVQGFWRDIDGMMDYEGLEGKYVDPAIATYTLKADSMAVMTFHKDVPPTKEIPTGRYEYIPVATYQVNPIKAITRPLPSQFVNVVCDYDPAKHFHIGGK